MLRCLKFILDSTTRGCDILALLTETKDTFPDANFDILQELVNAGRETLKLPGDCNLARSGTHSVQPGFIRGLIVLDKQ